MRRGGTLRRANSWNTRVSAPRHIDDTIRNRRTEMTNESFEVRNARHTSENVARDISNYFERGKEREKEFRFTCVSLSPFLSLPFSLSPYRTVCETHFTISHSNCNREYFITFYTFHIIFFLYYNINLCDVRARIKRCFSIKGRMEGGEKRVREVEFFEPRAFSIARYRRS